jgi:type 1 glutamine amidotransferase
MWQVILLLAFLLPLSAAPIRVQVTTGGHPHDLSFYSLFEGYDDLQVTVNPHPSSYRRPLVKSIDVLVLYDLNDVNDEKERQNLRAFLEGGGGLVVLHHALADNWQWNWWYEDVVGGRFLMGQEGEKPRSVAKAPVTLDVRPVVEHPVLEGVGRLKIEDEGYKGMYLSQRSRVLMETESPDNDRGVAWIGPWQKSRVIAIQLGHGSATHHDPGYRRLIYNSILWAAGRK